MRIYQPWDFCRSINCTVMVRTEEQRRQLCKDCKAYQMHDYLQKQGLILDEKSGLKEQTEQLGKAFELACKTLADTNEYCPADHITHNGADCASKQP